METEEERIQRLVKEGLIKAKADEEWETKKRQGLDSVSWGNLTPVAIIFAVLAGSYCLIIGMSNISIIIISSVVFAIFMAIFSLVRGSTRKVYETPESLEKVTSQNTKQQAGKPIAGIFLMVFITVILAAIIGAFVFDSNNIGNNGVGEPVPTRAEIFETATNLKHACENSGWHDGCQEYLDYIYANRAVLDSGTIPNWATDIIPKIEKQIAKTSASNTQEQVSSVTPKPTNRPFDYCGGRSGADLERCLASSYDNDEILALYEDCVIHAADISSLAKVKHARNVCGVAIRRLTSGTIVTYGGFNTDEIKQTLWAIDAQLAELEKAYASMP